jgi:hypothetical protein
MKNVRLLGRLGKKLLKLESAPAHSHACTGAGLKRPYQSRAFFQQEASAVFLLAVYTLHGHKCNMGKSTATAPINIQAGTPVQSLLWKVLRVMVLLIAISVP